MNYLQTLTLLLGLAISGISLALSAPTKDSPELFLTPLIKEGKLDKARAAASDNVNLANVKSEKDIKSYSGYFTIDEAKNANLFFWFFPAQENPETAPVILWLHNLPGLSCLKHVFLETGPFEVDDNNRLVGRNHTWTKTHSMLYIDAPVGTGFSFADDESGYANSSEEEAAEIVEALKQFFTLFIEFGERDFYLAGESFATTIIPYVAKQLDKDGGVNLKGFIIGSPYLDSNQLLRTKEWYAMGLMDEFQRDDFEDRNVKQIAMGRAGKVEEAAKIGFELYIDEHSLWHNYTGFNDLRSALISNPPAEIAKLEKFLSSKEVHNYLHVGLHPFVESNPVVFKHLIKDFLHSHSAVVEELLDKGYRALFYAPQFDVWLTVKGISAAVRNLKWKGAEKLATAPRKIWRVKDDVAGYVKVADNLTFAVVRNAGNYGIMDQPERMLELVEKFLRNQEI